MRRTSYKGKRYGYASGKEAAGINGIIAVLVKTGGRR